MSEYWKSTPKYWCKHCSAYVKDTPFEKKQHESTGKHQGNLKRFLRDIQNGHERDEREKQKAKAEVDRLNKVVGGAAATSSSTSTPLLPREPPQTTPIERATAADRKKQIAQLVEMGIAVPDEFRADMALAGDWKVLSTRPVEEPEPEPQASLSTGVRKRKFEGQDEEEEAGETVASRGWGSTKRSYPGQVTADLEALLRGGILLKKEEPVSVKGEDDQLESSAAKQDLASGANTVPVKTEKADEIETPGSTMADPAPIFFKKRKSRTAG